MKDFIKWLGVNEKVAKVVVWLLIIMVTLIIFNAGLESIGLPYYAITYKNLIKLNTDKTFELFLSCIVCILNFYSIVLLVLNVKETKNIFKYSILYLILNWIIKEVLGYGVLQIFIILFNILFCYYYKNKNKKYILYGAIAVIINILIQGIWYTTKAQFIDYSQINDTTKIILSFDFFIIMGIIILVKEIYLKKRSEKLCGVDQDAFYGSANSKTKANSQRKSQKK